MNDFYNHNIIVDYNNNNNNNNNVDGNNIGNNVDVDVTDEERYQKQYLECLYFDEYNDTEVMCRIYSIYNLLKDNNEIKKYCDKIQQLVPMLSLIPNIEDKAPNAFIFLFSYDYFEYFHLCLIDLIKTGTITQENDEKIMQKIENTYRK